MASFTTQRCQLGCFIPPKKHFKSEIFQLLFPVLHCCCFFTFCDIGYAKTGKGSTFKIWLPQRLLAMLKLGRAQLLKFGFHKGWQLCFFNAHISSFTLRRKRGGAKWRNNQISAFFLAPSSIRPDEILFHQIGFFERGKNLLQRCHYAPLFCD